MCDHQHTHACTCVHTLTVITFHLESLIPYLNMSCLVFSLSLSLSPSLPPSFSPSCSLSPPLSPSSLSCSFFSLLSLPLSLYLALSLTQELEQMIEPFGEISHCQVFVSPKDQKEATSSEPAMEDVSSFGLESSESDSSCCYLEWQNQLKLPRCSAYVR